MRLHIYVGWIKRSVSPIRYIFTFRTGRKILQNHKGKKQKIMPAHAALLEKTPEMVPKFIPLKMKATRKAKPERPGWIPSHITENWDTDWGVKSDAV